MYRGTALLMLLAFLANEAYCFGFDAEKTFFRRHGARGASFLWCLLHGDVRLIVTERSYVNDVCPSLC